MANKLDVSHGYIAMLEKGINNRTGKEPAPSIYFFADFARLAGISVDDLLRMTDGAQPVTIPPKNKEKEELFHLIDALPEDSLHEAVSYLRYLAQSHTRNAKGA